MPTCITYEMMDLGWPRFVQVIDDKKVSNEFLPILGRKKTSRRSGVGTISSQDAIFANIFDDVPTNERCMMRKPVIFANSFAG